MEYKKVHDNLDDVIMIGFSFFDFVLRGSSLVYIVSTKYFSDWTPDHPISSLIMSV